jgi:hypothetical protein
VEVEEAVVVKVEHGAAAAAAKDDAPIAKTTLMVKRGEEEEGKEEESEYESEAGGPVESVLVVPQLTRLAPLIRGHIGGQPLHSQLALSCARHEAAEPLRSPWEAAVRP